MNRVIQRPFLLFITLLLSAFVSGNCNRVREGILPHTELIFPIESGKYRISLVTDTTYTTAGLNAPQVERYYKKEETGEIEQDLDGRNLHKIHVFESEFDLGQNYDFNQTRVWAQYKPDNPVGDYFAERIEENRRILILKFPVYPDISWNANLYNSLGNQSAYNEYYYQEVDTTVVVQGKTYEHCVMVVHENTDGFIRKSFAYEIYAPEVGLIKKYRNTLVMDGPPGKEFNPDESRIYLEELVEHNY